MICISLSLGSTTDCYNRTPTPWINLTISFRQPRCTIILLIRPIYYTSHYHFLSTQHPLLSITDTLSTDPQILSATGCCKFPRDFGLHSWTRTLRISCANYLSCVWGGTVFNAVSLFRLFVCRLARQHETMLADFHKIWKTGRLWIKRELIKFWSDPDHIPDTFCVFIDCPVVNWC